MNIDINATPIIQARIQNNLAKRVVGRTSPYPIVEIAI
jgi:hypothetical protein